MRAEFVRLGRHGQGADQDGSKGKEGFEHVHGMMRLCWLM
jgi:hypothetical protein